MTRPSLQDISEATGISKANISRILSGARTPQTKRGMLARDRVLAAAEKLGYRPHVIARSLRTGRTNTIGIVTEGDITWPPLSMLERCAARRGYVILAASHGSSEQTEDAAIERLLHREVDGLLVVAPTTDPGQRNSYSALVSQGFPIVGIGPTRVPGASWIDWDRCAAYMTMTKDLLERGCRRLLFLGAGDSVWAAGERRLEGVREAVNGVRGAELRALFCRLDKGDVHFVDVARALRQELASAWPDAVVCQDDKLATMTMLQAHGLGIGMPENLAVTGCSSGPDQFPDGMFFVPRTTVAVPVDQLVESALRALLDRTEHPDQPHEVLQRSLPAEVIIRQSSFFGSGR